jgi:cytochrome P450
MNDSELAQLLPHWDTYAPEHEKLRVDVLRYARQNAPVAWTDALGGMFLVTRFEDVQQVALDWQTFSSVGGLPTPMPLRICPIDADPPLQSSLRQMLNPLFSRTYLSRYVPMMEKLAADLVDSWANKGSVELVSDFAAPYVGTILMNIVMGEMEPEQAQRVSDAVIGCAHEGTPENFLALVGASMERLASAEADPGNASPVLRGILDCKVDGRPLEQDERLGVLNILFLGGLDTTRAAISMIALRLAARPELEKRLRDPGWIRQDLDEFLRIDTPVATFGRVATKDTELVGLPIKKGQRLLLRYDSANRDEARFPAPDTLIFDDRARRPTNTAFSLGIHRCVGSNLARLQIPIAWDRILSRVTNLRLSVDPTEIIWAPGLSNGPATVPLTFDVSPSRSSATIDRKTSE